MITIVVKRQQITKPIDKILLLILNKTNSYFSHISNKKTTLDQFKKGFARIPYKIVGGKFLVGFNS
jgi:hypothetical protein